MLQIRVLGELQVLYRGRDVTPTAPKLRQLIALLGVNANSVTTVRKLTEELWGDDLHDCTLQTYVYHLRKTFRDAGQCTSGRPVIGTAVRGYVLMAGRDDVDSSAFARAVDQAGVTLAEGDARAGAGRLREALTLWRGPAFLDVKTGPVLGQWATWFEELHKSALEKTFDAELAIGRHNEIVHELSSLATAEPTHESFARMLMLALHRSGRRADALQAFRRARAALREELGVEPSEALCTLQRDILNGDPGLTGTVRPAPSGPSVCAVRDRAEAEPVPGTRDVGPPVGRAGELASAQAVLAGPPGPASVLVLGAPGSGKTTFCLYLAQRLRAVYPDGILLAELTTGSGEVVDPADVVGQLLAGLGVSPVDAGRTVEDRLVAFETLTAHRRVLVVLDDVASQDQLDVLCPARLGCAAIVAGRRRLPPRHYTTTVFLEPLGRRDSLEILTAGLDRRRLDREPDRVDELITLCGGLPAALNAAVDELEIRPHWSVSTLVERMRSGSAGADPGNPAGRGLRRSTALVSHTARDVFDRLSTRVEPVSAEVVARELGVDGTAAETGLEQLVEFQLAEVVPADPADGFRYVLRQPFGGSGSRSAGGRADVELVGDVLGEQC